jgi:glycosyltransferase involved in cell wall biosynthesis
LPTISLVTPSYNQGRYLEECIDSVLSQGYPNLEYIIMDGGSTDNSVAIIKKYEKYLTYWQSRPDGGQYAAVNEGFRKTTGGIMTWLNSDDKYHRNAFLMVAAVFMNRHDVEWITGRSNTFNEKGEQSWICEYAKLYSRSKYLKKEFSNPWIQQEGTFWRRSLWETSGASLKTDLEYAGDLELWARFFRFARLYSIDALLAGYRIQSSAKSRLFMDKYLKEADRILDKEIQLFREGVYMDLLAPAEQIESAEIREVLAQVEKVNPDIVINFYEGDGNLSLKSGHHHALEFFERSKKMNPDNCNVRNSLGMLYWQDGEVKKAIGEFVKALRINPDFPDALINLGDVLTRIKETDKAHKLYSSYLSMNPQEKDLLNIVTISNN